MKLFEILDGHRKVKNFSCIYRWVNNVNNKIYIGQTIHFYDRISQYKNGKGTPLINRALQKYGFDNFDIDVMEYCQPENLDNREQYWINYYQSYDSNKGYNICSVASSTKGFHHSEETKSLLRELSKARDFHLFGEKNGMYGKHHSEEWRETHSQFLKEQWKNPEYRQKQSERMSGENNYFYDVHLYGELNPRYGKHCTEETKEKIRQALTGKPNIACSMKVLCVETGQEFNSMTEAAKFYNTYASAIKLAVDYPETRTCKGFHWRKI